MDFFLKVHYVHCNEYRNLCKLLEWEILMWYKMKFLFLKIISPSSMPHAMDIQRIGYI
jgi:hypothetical protein